jgi:hypothetical protein
MERGMFDVYCGRQKLTCWKADGRILSDSLFGLCFCKVLLLSVEDSAEKQSTGCQLSSIATFLK